MTPMQTAAPTGPNRTAAPSERVTIARTVEEVEALRPAWERLQVPNLDADLDYFLTVVAHRREVLRPHVVLIERPEGDMLIVARLERAPLESRLGYRVVAKPVVRTLVVSFDGVVGAETDEACRRAVDELRRPLLDGEADVVMLPGLRLDGTLASVARNAGSFLTRDHVIDPVNQWDVAIPDTLDAFLAGRSNKTRKNLRYYARRLERTYADVSVRVFEDESDLGELCADMEAVAAKTYQRRLGAGYQGTDFDHALMALCLRRGWMKAWVLRIDGKPVAFWHGAGYRGTFSVWTPGFDPEFANDRVGIHLLAQVIEDLCADPAIHTLDYGHGEADYKRSFGDGAREVGQVLLFAPRPRAIRVNAVRTALAAATRLANRLLEGSDRGQRLKKAWRARISAPARDDG
jgi:CelD/BcsL family acetyltransferase involved in cellulose biosynthesis